MFRNLMRILLKWRYKIKGNDIYYLSVDYVGLWDMIEYIWENGNVFLEIKRYMYNIFVLF